MQFPSTVYKLRNLWTIYLPTVTNPYWWAALELFKYNNLLSLMLLEIYEMSDEEQFVLLPSVKPKNI